MKIQLLVDSKEFWNSLQRDIHNSTKCIYIQTLSFEGDSVGEMLSSNLLSCNSRDIRVIVDYYTKYVISDRFIYTLKNIFDKDLREETRKTHRMIEELRRNNIKVKFTNPVGPLLIRFPLRNHKKMILIDEEISYFGGINFSEHNFEWHDLMIRVEDLEINSFLKRDFLLTWEGIHRYSEIHKDKLSLYLFDGDLNDINFNVIFDLIEKAQKRIIVHSPYLSFPFYGKLRRATDRAINVIVVAPRQCNRKMIGKYTLWEASRSKFDLRLYEPRMTHAKYMLIDDKVLAFGSTNFDYISFKGEQELLALITDEDIINDFIRRVVDVELQDSKKFDENHFNFSGFLNYAILRISGKIATFIAKL